MKRATRAGRIAIAAVAATTWTLTACASNSGGGAGGTNSTAAPKNVQFIVDTGPGGGSDLFARQLVKIARNQHVLNTNWPVVSQPQGGGLGAMAFLKGKSSQNNYVAAFTSKWIIAGLSTKSAPATLKDLTPIAELAEETQVIAARADAPYNTTSEFLAAAKAKPGELVQVGGSVNSVDNLVALQIEKLSGTQWKYLSFDDGGSRITSLLRGDAQIDIGAESDFHDQIAAGKLKLIGVFGDKRMDGYPNVPTIAEDHIDLGQLPDQLQFRGIAGPPNMPPAAVKYYQDLLSKVVNTSEWTDYLKSEGLVSHFVTGDALTTLLGNFTTAATPLVESLVQSGS